MECAAKDTSPHTHMYLYCSVIDKLAAQRGEVNRYAHFANCNKSRQQSSVTDFVHLIWNYDAYAERMKMIQQLTAATKATEGIRWHEIGTQKTTNWAA